LRAECATLCWLGNSYTIFVRQKSSATIARIARATIHHCLREINVMARSVKAIATLASVAVLAGSILAVSWVGLALLGY
jgi:hypothetical protein